MFTFNRWRAQRPAPPAGTPPPLIAVAAFIVLYSALLTGLPAPASAQDVSATWDALAATYNFETTQGQSAAATFTSAYSGLQFAADLDALLRQIDKLHRPLALQPPPIDGDDYLLGTLANYPDE